MSAHRVIDVHSVSASVGPLRRSARPRSNPSSPEKRAVVAAVAFLGAAIAARLAAYQLGWTGPPWEPFFGDGSRRVLESSFSRALPFPDAGLGAIAYAAEIVAVAWGGRNRWRDRRAAVFVYAAIAGAMAIGSAGLVAMQALFVHAFCTLCLASAVISFALAVPAAFEAAAAWSAREKENGSRLDAE